MRQYFERLNLHWIVAGYCLTACSIAVVGAATDKKWLANIGNTMIATLVLAFIAMFVFIALGRKE